MGKKNVHLLCLEDLEDNPQKELNKIWSHNWVYVCHESSLIDNLSYKTITISKQSILILKDKEGSILAYLNTCKHRGSIILDNLQGKLKSNVLVCPYHQWSYNASDGFLLKTSSKPNEDFDISKYGLKKMVFHVKIFLVSQCLYNCRKLDNVPLLHLYQLFQFLDNNFLMI